MYECDILQYHRERQQLDAARSELRDARRELVRNKWEQHLARAANEEVAELVGRLQKLIHHAGLAPLQVDDPESASSARARGDGAPHWTDIIRPSDMHPLEPVGGVPGIRVPFGSSISLPAGFGAAAESEVDVLGEVLQLVLQLVARGAQGAWGLAAATMVHGRIRRALGRPARAAARRRPRPPIPNGPAPNKRACAPS